MKKIIYPALILLVLTMAAIMSIRPLKAVSQKKIANESYSIPDNVSQILKNSCVSCHNAGGNGMAASIWSFSAWDKYSVKKQFKKAKNICVAMNNGSMPPASVGKERIPTAGQIETVCSWASSLPPK